MKEERDSSLKMAVFVVGAMALLAGILSACGLVT